MVIEAVQSSTIHPETLLPFNATFSELTKDAFSSLLSSSAYANYSIVVTKVNTAARSVAPLTIHPVMLERLVRRARAKDNAKMLKRWD